MDSKKRSSGCHKDSAFLDVLRSMESNTSAEVIGRRLKLPFVSKSSKDAAARFSWFAPFVVADNPVSSLSTQKNLGWQPAEPALIPDIDRPSYFNP